MELGGSSSSSSNSSDSLNGLKFGQKIYFENVGVGVPAKTGGGSSSAATAAAGGLPPASPAKKGRSVISQAGQPPRCQVEGCKLDLSDAKAYYSRHKVCGMHSKSPKVIVGGLEQRFCQQCSRFHQLPEFDKGKRSCRRRLAGHNERRRKPPPGSLLSARYGNLPSSIFENNSRAGSFLMDFTTYPRLNGRDPWQNTKASAEHVSGNPLTVTAGKFLPSLWQGNPGNPPSDHLLLQGSTSRIGYASPGVPSGECFMGVSDSSCALSLLSKQPWGLGNRPSTIGVNNILNADGATMFQPATSQGSAINHLSSTSWDFKVNVASGSSSSSTHNLTPDLGLGHLTQSTNSQYSGELELSQQSGRQYMELDHSRAYDSTAQHMMHWSL